MGFSNLELEGKGGGNMMGVTRLRFLGQFYTIQMQFYVLLCTRLYYINLLLIKMAVVHSWVLGVDNLAKWQKNILQLKYLGGFMAMNLQILDK